MPTSARFTARLRVTAWASRCTHVYLEGDLRRKREAQQWAADDIYRDLAASLPSQPGVPVEVYTDVVNSARPTGRTR